MIYLDRAFSQGFTPDELPAAVRSTLGKPLRRAAALTQLAVVGALAALPESARTEPCALLWQSTSGPRPETLTLLDEMCHGTGEPMPYDEKEREESVYDVYHALGGNGTGTHIHQELQTAYVGGRANG